MMANIHLTTDRFILRDLESSDAEGLFKLDADPRVHEFLGKNPLTKLEQAKEVIEMVRGQYIKNGMGRWAIEEKSTGNFIGWCGLKYEEKVRDFPYYDLGYRLIHEHWGKGIATETALACVKHGFNKMGLDRISGAADVNHHVSNHILQKVGLKFVEEFIYDQTRCNFYTLDRIFK